MTSAYWSRRVYLGLSTIAWCAALNALWIGFTVLGGVVFGVGPATVTACAMSRRRSRGDSVSVREFAVRWRRELLPGTVVIVPALVVVGVLWSNYSLLSALGPRATPARLAVLGMLVLAVAATAYLGPMYAHYEMPRRAYFVMAVRFALARPASTVIVLLVGSALTFVTAAFPILLPSVSIGVWLHTSTYLGVRFFDENEARRSRPPSPPLSHLPTQPLRMR